MNYARWLPIHLKDMLTLDEKHPQIAEVFHAGKFVVHKTGRNFLGMVIDQAHEQANAIIKGDGGAISITEDPSALRRWMVAGQHVQLSFSTKDAQLFRPRAFGVKHWSAKSRKRILLSGDGPKKMTAREFFGQLLQL